MIEFIKKKLDTVIFKVNFVSLYKFVKKYIVRRKKVPYALGAIKDIDDPRDIVYKVRRYKGLPESTNRQNIRKFCHRYDQKSLGSCVGHGVAEAYRHVLKVNGQPDFAPSRLFAYYIAREDKKNDTGASIQLWLSPYSSGIGGLDIVWTNWTIRRGNVDSLGFTKSLWTSPKR